MATNKLWIAAVALTVIAAGIVGFVVGTNLAAPAPAAADEKSVIRMAAPITTTAPSGLPVELSPGDVISYQYASFSKPSTEVVVEVREGWLLMGDAEKKYVPRWINTRQINYFWKRVPE